MSTLLKRWLIYLFIPAGLVLLILPLNTYRTEEVEKDFVFLEISESLAKDTGVKIRPVAPENPDEENLLQYVNGLQKMVSGEDSNVVTTNNQSGYPIIQKQMLASYPALIEQIDHMLRMISLLRQERMRPRRLDDVSIEEWTSFTNAFLGNTDATAFQYGSRIFRGHVESDYASIQVEVKNLRMSTKVAGGIFLFLSLFALYGMYASPSKGIQIGKRMGMIIWDVITIGIGIIFTWWFLDFILIKYFQTDPAWGDEMAAAGMGIFWVAFANPVIALIGTATALQTLWITGEGIAVKGLFGQSVMAWSDVESIEVSEFFAPRTVNGIFAPRKVAKVLKIRGGTSPLRILEPPLASTKKEILHLLTEYAPVGLKETISGLSREWLSVW